MKHIRKQIEWLLGSEVTGYEIERETGVARTTISQLRKGDANIDNITLAKAEKLAEYTKERKKNAFEKWRDCIKSYNDQPQIAIVTDEDLLKEVCEDENTLQICLDAVKKNGMDLLYVPSDFRTEKICIEAVKQNGLAMKYVPKEIIALPNFCLRAVSYDPDALIYIPDELLTLQIGIIVADDEESFECLPGSLQKRVKEILKMIDN